MGAHTQNKRIIVLATIVSRCLVLCIAQIASYLPLFDASPFLLLPNPNTSPDTTIFSRWTSTLLRWDAFHFSHIALHGYVFEYEWAFFPGIAFVMRYAGILLRRAKAYFGHASVLSLEDVLQGGALAALLCDFLAPLTLYDLTVEHFHSRDVALVTALTSLLPGSPAALRHAPYTEPFFAYLSYKGMVSCTRKRYAAASCYFAAASAFRSNGILLSGFIVWDILLAPILSGTKRMPDILSILKAVILAAPPLVPSIIHQYIAYRLFCSPNPNLTSIFAHLPPTVHFTPASWCNNMPPSIYTYAQSTYWNVGLFRYWTTAQIPNFLIAAPVLALLFSFSWWYIRHALLPPLKRMLYPQSASPSPAPHSRRSDTPGHGEAINSDNLGRAFLNPTLAPHAIHAFILASTLLFASHVQIALRLTAGVPFTYWGVVWLLSRDKTTPGHPNAAPRFRWGKIWITWSAIWGALSIILWVTFLPPA
ncbi:mannosyltransferase [Punctularia strigosozonata HHB-11173 SS5]|uniref:mannosyltransferase n=1 Tax=Punctularia strigosozonata (strain HHB-11173) TaxID=741275 RepID=UPI000441851E|nr:mannosyltransferase [Punctularia strigosozonata HHB-11173 SS5]EIN11410.1 mannosyltransferase [Punctularia strigosozonata HHB-11173 SS5]